jgi:PmbA protein
MTDTHLLDDLLTRAKQAGATSADALLVRSTSLSVSVRTGKVEHIERSESTDLGLRVFKGHKQAVIATSDLRSDKLAELVSRVVSMADATPEDPFAGIADPALLSKSAKALDLAEANEPDPSLLIKAAGEAEAAALAVSGITNTEGGDASWGRSEITLATSNGFSGSYARTSCGISATALAGTGTNMERDYDYDSATYWTDLRDAASIGRIAAERAVKRLNPKRVSSQQVPIIFESRQARDIVGHLVSAINGSSVARKSTFLKDKLGQAVCGSHITIHEDPFVLRGSRSRPFDGEGLAPQARRLVDNGVLTTLLLDLRSARQLNLAPTGHGARGVGSPPSPSATNVWLEAGNTSVNDMIADIKQGFFVTDCLGHGTNMVTGDYSRGASGFWIENGQLTYPVSELTIAGNLADMFMALQPASDLTRRFGMDSPSVLVTGMTVAGQ